MPTEQPPASAATETQDAATPFDRTIDTLACNPLRSLVYVALTQAETPLTGYAQASALNSLRGRKVPCEVTENLSSLIGTTLDKILIPARLIKPHGTRYAARQEKRTMDQALAIAGVLLDWELTHPNSSLALALGNNNADLECGRPTAALNVYRAILAGRNNKATILDIRARQRTNVGDAFLERLIGDLRHRGFITTHATSYEERTLNLQPPGVPSVQERGITSAARYACQHLLERGISQPTVSEFIDAARTSDQSQTPTRLQRALTLRKLPYITYADPVYAKAQYQIADGNRDAITRLVIGLDSLQNGRRHRQARQRAEEILQTPADARYLLDKFPVRSRQQDLTRQAAGISPQDHNRRLVDSLTLHVLPITPDWEKYGACKANLTLFDAAESDNPEVTEAQLICQRCPVQTSCLQYALDNKLTDGIYGGMTPEERHSYAIKPRVKP